MIGIQEQIQGRGYEEEIMKTQFPHYFIISLSIVQQDQLQKNELNGITFHISFDTYRFYQIRIIILLVM